MMQPTPSLVRPDLEGQSFLLQGGPTSVLLFHGFTATSAEVRLLANGLHDAGMTVAGPLLPGHGTTPEELNRTGFKAWQDTAEKFYFDLKTRSAQVFVGGESMGGLVALWLASKHPEIKGVVLYAPALSVPALRWVEWVAPFVQTSQKHNIDETMAWQGYSVYPLKGAVQMRKLQRIVRAGLPKISQPLLVFQGRLDGTIDPLCGQEILSKVKSARKELVWMEASGHCIILDTELPAVLTRTLNFIRLCQTLSESPE